MSSFKNAEAAERAVQAARVERAKTETRTAVYNAHQDFVRCMANDKAIIDLIEQWTDYDSFVLPSAELFELALAENPDFSFVRQSEAVTRAQLTKQIIALLEAHGKGHDIFTLTNEKKRLATFTIPALRSRLEDLQRAARMARQPVAELRQVVVDARPNYGFPALPKTVWDGSKHVPLDASAFRSMSTFDLKRYCRIYGDAVVNQRIAQG